MTTRLATVSFLVLFGSAAFAQTSYSPAGEMSVSGIITSVISVAGPDGTVGVHFVVKTAAGPVRVAVAPAMFIGMNNFSFLTEDAVAVRGAKVGKGTDEAIWARLIMKGSDTLVLRDDDGTPRWPRATADDPDGCGVSHAPIR